MDPQPPLPPLLPRDTQNDTHQVENYGAFSNLKGANPAGSHTPGDIMDPRCSVLSYLNFSHGSIEGNRDMSGYNTRPTAELQSDDACTSPPSNGPKLGMGIPPGIGGNPDYQTLTPFSKTTLPSVQVFYNSPAIQPVQTHGDLNGSTFTENSSSYSSPSLSDHLGSPHFFSASEASEHAGLRKYRDPTYMISNIVEDSTSSPPVQQDRQTYCMDLITPPQHAMEAPSSDGYGDSGSNTHNSFNSMPAVFELDKKSGGNSAHNPFNMPPGFDPDDTTEQTHLQGKSRRKRRINKDQRQAANQRERRRMITLNGAFEELQEKIPTFSYEKKLSRIETLKLAIGYIWFMREVLNGSNPEQVNLSYFLDSLPLLGNKIDKICTTYYGFQ